MTVCPTGASYKRAEDGIVLVDAALCIGCKLCSWACPYGAREFDGDGGVMKKCTLCVDRIYDEKVEEAESLRPSVKDVGSSAQALDKSRLLQMYEQMMTIRQFEERAGKEFASGKVPGFVHLYAGEEAVAVGVCTHLTDDDYITSHHRGHGQGHRGGKRGSARALPRTSGPGACPCHPRR